MGEGYANLFPGKHLYILPSRLTSTQDHRTHPPPAATDSLPISLVLKSIATRLKCIAFEEPNVTPFILCSTVGLNICHSGSAVDASTFLEALFASSNVIRVSAGVIQWDIAFSGAVLSSLVIAPCFMREPPSCQSSAVFPWLDLERLAQEALCILSSSSSDTLKRSSLLFRDHTTLTTPHPTVEELFLSMCISSDGSSQDMELKSRLDGLCLSYLEELVHALLREGRLMKAMRVLSDTILITSGCQQHLHAYAVHFWLLALKVHLIQCDQQISTPGKACPLVSLTFPRFCIVS